jgi:hypothetical protein
LVAENASALVGTGGTVGVVTGGVVEVADVVVTGGALAEVADDVVAARVAPLAVPDAAVDAAAAAVAAAAVAVLEVESPPQAASARAHEDATATNN